jgi:hypothetical protein
VDSVHVFPTLFGAVHGINEVAVEKVRQHGAPTLSPLYHFFFNEQSGVSFFLSFFPFLPFFVSF